MTKKIILTALSAALTLGVAAPAYAEIIDYGYGNYYGSNYGYGNSYGGQYGTNYGYGYGMTVPTYGMGAYGTITRDLTIGSYGSDVQALEAFLTARGYMTSPSIGYYSLATANGVARFQQSVGITPVSGYFGPMTRAYYNAQFAQSPYGTQYGSQYSYLNQYQYPYSYGGQYPYNGYQTNCPSGYSSIQYGGQYGCVQNSSYYGNGNNGLSGGTASLRNFNIDSGNNSTVVQGEYNDEIARVRFHVNGSDVRMQRMDVRFDFTGSNNGENLPWNVFRNVRIMGGNNTLQTIDTSNRYNWTPTDSGYVLRFSSLSNYVIYQGDDADLRIQVDVNNYVNGAGSNRVQWDVSVPTDGVRVVDSQGVNQTIGRSGDTVRVRVNY